ncbi:protein-export membrane protein SecF [Desulfosarcina ovata subsp. sediminis]|uniref:Protein-export membrane protein SecF n=1 Tax=Desulfosarcina ovata subsp. sediminis TaxID=885957 RepID=A0A5K7ZNB7_9BACT|nr:protein translocase subunit SecF [Desulfosarcina ovata]BBO81767.1 protein-export membrane protein SecF [Desulfosarcina ovata subsp. sediminis]
MQFIKPGINIDFVGKRKIAFTISLLLIAVSIVTLIVNQGPRYGIDFAGGTLVQVKFAKAVTIDRIKSGLETIDMTASAVQQFGHAADHEYLIRTDTATTAVEGLAERIETGLKASTGVDAETRRVEMVGPQVGKDLREKALFAMFYSLLFITVYISGRFEMKWGKSAIVAAAIMGAVYLLSLFNVSIPFLMLAALIVSLVVFWFFEFKYAMGAIVALIHDVTITVGVFSIFDKEFTLPIVAALLTIIGYSLNDTIIVFDRIRENLRKYHKEPMMTILNKSVNETLSRTILTSGTTLIVVIALFVLGGGIIHDFSFALLVGVMVGTYSSVYVASPILLAWQNRRK